MDEEERHAGIVALLEGNNVESEEEFDEEEPESQSVEEESDAYDEFEEEEETSVEATDDDDDDEYEVEEGHRVPYDRFKQINDRRHALQSELEAREGTIAELQQRLSERQAAPEQGSDEENDFSIFDETEPDDIAYLKQQTQEMQVKFATMELENEVSVATQTYPNVPEEYIWDSLANDGNQNASDIAAQYSTWVAGVEEAAIARYLEGNNQDETGASAPPRPSRKQTARSQPGKEDWKPQTTDEAREAMVEYLRS
tara:strand:+ start:5081 stop:5848 length:768 start_codon:yes stop_codon:yes gene_type:complete